MTQVRDRRRSGEAEDVAVFLNSCEQGKFQLGSCRLRREIEHKLSRADRAGQRDAKLLENVLAIVRPLGPGSSGSQLVLTPVSGKLPACGAGGKRNELGELTTARGDCVEHNGNLHSVQGKTKSCCSHGPLTGSLFHFCDSAGVVRKGHAKNGGLKLQRYSCSQPRVAPHR